LGSYKNKGNPFAPKLTESTPAYRHTVPFVFIARSKQRPVVCKRIEQVLFNIFKLSSLKIHFYHLNKLKNFLYVLK